VLIFKTDRYFWTGSGIMHSGSWKNTAFILASGNRNSMKKQNLSISLEWKDEGTMKTTRDKFMADKEWKEIKAETAKLHGGFVNNIEDRKLKLTEFSPQNKLLK